MRILRLHFGLLFTHDPHRTICALTHFSMRFNKIRRNPTRLAARRGKTGKNIRRSTNRVFSVFLVPAVRSASVLFDRFQPGLHPFDLFNQWRNVFIGCGVRFFKPALKRQ